MFSWRQKWDPTQILKAKTTEQFAAASVSRQVTKAAASLTTNKPSKVTMNKEP